MPQDKLTAVRIKQENGEYGPQIPVAAKAENVEYNEEYSVKEVLGDININKGPLQEQIENIDTSTIQAALEARLDEWEEQAQIPVTSVAIDSYLTNQGQAADAKQAGKVVTINNEANGNATKLHLNTSNDIVNIALMDDLNTKINRPIKNSQYDNGEQGQLLRTNGDGSTEWVDEGTPTYDQVHDVVEELLQDNPSWRANVQDGSLTEAKFTDELKLKTLKDYVTPEMFGAKGNGVTDDTAALQYMLDSTNDPILLSGQYKITTGLIVNKPRNIFAFNRTAVIFGNTNDYIFRITHSDNDVADYRNYFLYNIGISQTGSGNALQIDNYEDKLISFEISNCRLFTPYDTATGYSLYCDNSLCHSEISRCNIQGNGIYGKFRDANVIRKCLLFGKGNGVIIDAANGCLNNTIEDNTIVNYDGNAIKIINGDRILISNNQIEYAGGTDQTVTTKGMLYIEGRDRSCTQIIVSNNNFGGGTHLDYLIYIKHADDTVITKNRLVAVNQAEIYIHEQAMRTIVAGDNIGITQQSNPRTNKYDHYIVDDHGQGTMGVWRSMLIQDSQSRTIEFMKTEDGIVHFKQLYIPSLTINKLCTLPLYFRPESTVTLLAISADGSNQILIQVSYSGDVTMLSAPPTQKFYAIVGTFTAMRYT